MFQQLVGSSRVSSGEALGTENGGTAGLRAHALHIPAVNNTSPNAKSSVYAEVRRLPAVSHVSGGGLGTEIVLGVVEPPQISPWRRRMLIRCGPRTRAQCSDHTSTLSIFSLVSALSPPHVFQARLSWHGTVLRRIGRCWPLCCLPRGCLLAVSACWNRL